MYLDRFMSFSCWEQIVALKERNISRSGAEVSGVERDAVMRLYGDNEKSWPISMY
jgi:hypothetical protein